MDVLLPILWPDKPESPELKNVTKGHIREGNKYIGSHDGSQGWDYNSHGTNEDLKSDIQRYESEIGNATAELARSLLKK